MIRFGRAKSVLLVMSLIAGGSPAMSQTEPKAPVRTIRLDSMGGVKAKPDIAQITLGVTAEADTARAALDQNSAAMTRVIEALKQTGLVEEDIQTIDFAVRSRFENSKTEGKNVITGYRVVNLIRITVRDLTKLGDILDRAVSQGSNEMGGIQFNVADPAKLLDEARKRAMDSARRKAELYAQAAGSRLGRVITIDEQSVSPWRANSMTSMRMDTKAMDVPIQPGEAELQVNISVLWELIEAAPKP